MFPVTNRILFPETLDKGSVGCYIQIINTEGPGPMNVKTLEIIEALKNDGGERIIAATYNGQFLLSAEWRFIRMHLLEISPLGWKRGFWNSSHHRGVNILVPGTQGLNV